jgi:hypothetical protein
MGEVTKVFHYGVRYYQKVGDPRLFPSVTSILKVATQPTLERWIREKEFRVIRDHLKERIESNLITTECVDNAIDEAKKSAMIMDPSASFGLESHDMIENILKSGSMDESVECPEHLIPVKQSFFRWYKREKELRNMEILHTELPLVSQQHGYAGTADAIAKVTIRGETKIVVLDWKTSNQLRNHYALQIAAYSKLYEENYNEPIYAGVVIKFSKMNADYEVRSVTNLEKVFDHFLSYKLVWDLEQKDVNLFDQIRVSPAEIPTESE